MAQETAGAVPDSGVVLSLLARGDGFVVLRAAVAGIAPPVVLRFLRLADSILLNLRTADNPGLSMSPPLTETSVPLEPGFAARIAARAGQVAASAAARAVAAIAAQPSLDCPEAPGAATALLQAARAAARVATERESARIAAAAEVHAALYFTLRHAERSGLLAPAAAEEAP